ncbi:MAG: UbiA family prenyltransferase [Phycisphaerales bacterium]|nr:UbiA family prenyltransferase [Phycisphaerales bacterium]
MTELQEQPMVMVCVDLDGTLIATDLLWESVLLLARKRPADLVRLPLWLMQGKARLKRELAARVRPDPTTLPYRENVLEFLRQCRQDGQSLLLATASNERLAHGVAEHLGLFDDVIASNEQANLKGHRKLEAIQSRCGEVAFDYVGDAKADLPLWRAARRAVLVHPEARLLEEAKRAFPSCIVLGEPINRLRAYVRLMRPHQWAKNALIAVPLLMSHQVMDLSKVLAVLLAMLAFNMAASAAYVFNDLFDMQSDRRHPVKRRRPLAAGKVSIPSASVLMLLLLGICATITCWLPLLFVALLICYIAVTLTYSLYFKRKLMVDVICLAGLYSLRILAGGAAAGVIVSPWLLAFSMFLFLSLAFVKRYTELAAGRESATVIPGRGYWAGDIEMVRSIGPASGYLCVLVLCLYISSQDVLKLYHHHDLLWLECPILLYWISRIWFLAHRQQMPDDPVLFAVKDKISLAAGAIALLILLLAWL